MRPQWHMCGLVSSRRSVSPKVLATRERWVVYLASLLVSAQRQEADRFKRHPAQSWRHFLRGVGCWFQRAPTRGLVKKRLREEVIHWLPVCQLPRKDLNHRQFDERVLYHRCVNSHDSCVSSHEICVSSHNLCVASHSRSRTK
jgi:hypothetical protein